MKNALVVEIGQHNLKIAASRSPQRKADKGLICSAKPITTLEDAQISKLITDTLQARKFKPRFAALSLARNTVAVRTLLLPSTEDSELAKMVDLHVVKVMPYKKDEMVNTYNILEKTDSGYSRILLTAVHKESLNRKLSILTEAGILTDKVHLSSSGIWEKLIYQKKPELLKDKVYLGLDIDYEYAEFIAFTLDKLLFTRCVVMPAEQLSGEEGRVKLIKELKQTMLIFKSELGIGGAEKLFVSGDFKDLEASGTLIQDQLGMPVEFVHNQQLSAESDMEIPRFVSTTAITEFLFDGPRRISFYVPELQVSKVFKEKVSNMILAGSILIYLFFIISCVFIARYYNRQLYLERLKGQTALIQEDIGSLFREAEMVKTTEEVLAKRKMPVLLFDDIQSLVPKSVALERINVDAEDKVLIRGQAVNISDVYLFTDAVKASDYFDDVSLNFVRKSKTRTQEVARFEMVANLTY